MWYGLTDVLRDAAGISAQPELREHEFWSVDNLSFELREGECLGLIGPNGAGKSSVLKMLNGVIRPDRGTITVRGRMGALIEVGAGFHPQLTGRENIYVNAAILGMSKAETQRKFDEIVEFAGIGDFLDSPVKFYSSGMFVRLGMAVAMHTDPQILLIDEVFAVGDIKFQAKCFNRIGELRRKGVSFILVSHNMHQIAGFSDRVLVLNRGRQYALGEPSPTVERFLDLMRDDPRNGTDELPNGSGRVRFVEVRLTNEFGADITKVGATEPVHVSITYEAAFDAKDVELDVGVYDAGETVFFRGSNLLRGQRLDLRRGRGTIQVRFDGLFKNNGRLHVTLALWSKCRYELFDWRRGLEIEVVGSSLSHGRVWLPCTFQATSASTAEAGGEPLVTERHGK